MCEQEKTYKMWMSIDRRKVKDMQLFLKIKIEKTSYSIF